MATPRPCTGTAPRRIDVVAVIRSNTLTVANAGDSRVVLCRREAVAPARPWPQDEDERARIQNAGGFVQEGA